MSDDKSKYNRDKNLKTQPDYRLLRVILAEHKLSLTYFKEIGIAYRTIKKIENDEFVSLQILCEICEHLNESPTFKRNDYNLKDICEFVPVSTPPIKEK